MKLDVPPDIAIELRKLIADYNELIDGEPGVSDELTVNAVLVQGIRWMREAHEAEANRRFAFRNGWPLDDDEEGGF